MADPNFVEVEESCAFTWTLNRYLCDATVVSETGSSGVTEYELTSPDLAVGKTIGTTWNVRMTLTKVSMNTRALVSLRQQQHLEQGRPQRNNETSMSASLRLVSTHNFPVKAKVKYELAAGTLRKEVASNSSGTELNKDESIDTALCSVSLEQLHEDMMLSFQITLMLPLQSRPQPSVAPAPPSLLHSLYSSRDWADVVLQTKGGNLKAHCLVLKASSSAFATMLTAESKESPAELDMKEYDTKLVEEMLRFLYTGEVGDLPTVACELLPIASKFELQGLKAYCLQQMTQDLTVDSAVAVYRVAASGGDTDIEGRARHFIRQNYAAVAQTQAWRDMKDDYKFFAGIFA